MNDVKILKSEYRKEREKRDLAIYQEYLEMMSIEGQSKMLVTQHLMKKYNVHSSGTIYLIRKRVEDMMKHKNATL